MLSGVVPFVSPETSTLFARVMVTALQPPASSVEPTETASVPCVPITVTSLDTALYPVALEVKVVVPLPLARK